MDFAGHSLPVRTVAESQSEMTKLILPNDTGIHFGQPAGRTVDALH